MFSRIVLVIHNTVDKMTIFAASTVYFHFQTLVHTTDLNATPYQQRKRLLTCLLITSLMDPLLFSLQDTAYGLQKAFQISIHLTTEQFSTLTQLILNEL